MASDRSYQMPRRGMVSQVEAAMTDRARVPRSTFMTKWTRKTAFNAGRLVPFLVEECYPGDHMKYDVTMFFRLSTLTFPVLDDQRCETFFFFVPSRILWTNFVKMMGQQDSPGDSINFSTPQVNLVAGGPVVGGIADHFGIPTIQQVAGGVSLPVNALPFRALCRLWHEWFRDEDLQPSTLPPTGDGPDAEANYAFWGSSGGSALLPRRAKVPDYFTMARPWPQKFTAPTVPLGGQAWVRGLGIDTLAVGAVTAPMYESPNVTVAGGYANQIAYAQQDGAGFPQVYADLSTATGVAINTLRSAFLVQQLLERDARGGTRYVEILMSHFDVNPQDYRLQRSEYLGGGSSPLNVSAIAQTAPTTGVPLGALGAASTVMGRHGCTYAAQEHGWIIGLVNIRTELSYNQGLHPMWTRRTRFEYMWPSLVELGEQAVLRKEIYCVGTPALDDTVFGYVPRYEELRTRTSEITGIMRTYVTGTLASWHFGENFAAAPTLGDTFIRDVGESVVQRAQAAGALALGQQYIGDILISRSATRPLPGIAVPARLGKF